MSVIYRRNEKWDPDYRREPKTKLYCAHCQKDLNPRYAYRRVHVIGGGGALLHPEDEAKWTAGRSHTDQACFPSGQSVRGFSACTGRIHQR